MTVDCVESLLACSYPSHTVVVVDNGSDDGTVKAIRRHFGGAIQIIASGTNLGFSAGNNLGIRAAAYAGADYILLMNNDAYASDPQFLTKLVHSAEADPSIAFASPSIYYADPPGRLWYAGARLSPWAGWKHYQSAPKDLETQDTGHASGCCVLARRGALQDIGLLNESYFLNVEDVEWSLRARRRDWRVVYVPSASVIHRVSASQQDPTAGRNSPISVYCAVRNRIWFLRDYATPSQIWLAWLPRLALDGLWHLAGYLAGRRWAKLAAFARGTWHGLTRSPGEASSLEAQSSLSQCAGE